MAILNKIREKTVVLILVIALALFAFILSGLFSNGDLLLGKSQNVVATINGEDVTREQFMAQVEQQQRRMGPQASSSQVMNSVFEAFVREAVMNTQFEKLGLSSSIFRSLKISFPILPWFLSRNCATHEYSQTCFSGKTKKAISFVFFARLKTIEWT